MNPPTQDPGRMLSQALSLLVEMVRPIIRDEIRSALAERQDHDEPPLYLDTAAFAQAAGLHPKYVERLAREGKIKSYRAGRKLRFKHEDLVRFVEGGKP